ncbi:MAG: cold shock and DUF1294 domain-containing protein [Proteobacteria bacterium]|nr:cold shock and DUF1294 domain-containing protein [Pseudomonadota bacterium]MBU4296925.1 cold shock and DUF1294 domain-containing protein [Pseudomonadota bacterium]MCG2746089.1 cold shock and DUF1294 domain-containing protein [Desulfobulbaceae bacterium]
MRIEGKITSWNDGKGFGFITPNRGGKQIFVHIKAFSNRNRRPVINELVIYALSADKQGRPCAVEVIWADAQFPLPTKQQNGSLSVIVAALFFAILGVSVLAARISPWLFVLYLVVSLFTFIMYAVDKSAAQKGAWRTKESTLHLLSLAGGWPGALVAQQKLRHKSRKQPFRFVFWVTVILNCGALGWFFTATGATTLEFWIADIVQMGRRVWPAVSHFL